MYIFNRLVFFFNKVIGFVFLFIKFLRLSYILYACVFVSFVVRYVFGSDLILLSIEGVVFEDLGVSREDYVSVLIRVWSVGVRS